jgi:hypothetical protein
MMYGLCTAVLLAALPAASSGFSPEVSGLRTRLHALSRDADGFCYARYTLFAGKGFRGRRSWIYPVSLRFFDTSGKPLGLEAQWHQCGEENFSDWCGTPAVLRFKPPSGAVFVSAFLRFDGADVVTETVLLPAR